MNNELFERVGKCLGNAGRPCIIAIDGRCGSGKSTCGRLLAEKYSGNLLHMDDFYLRKEQRTKERYQTPGENIDHERVKETLAKWVKHEPFVYQKFDHLTLEPGENIFMYPADLLVVEGSYSFHKDLRDFYDLKIFLDIDPALQRERLRKREGENFRMFQEKWIPLEELYFERLHVQDYADIYIRNFTL